MNEHRGEKRITIGGREFTLRPTYEAMANIEGRVGMGVLALAKKLMVGEIALREMAVIVFECAKASGQKDVNEKDIGERLFQDGMADHMTTVSDLMSVAIRGTNNVQSGKE